ncbi:RDD family protein [Clavibacter sp. Sh2126]|uniref:RDD family protein n=1 Tax=Clavibacter sp. Sh2126 TaxID=3397678 RepID=UPI0039E121E4
MAHALLGAVTCGRCGARVAVAVSTCARCASPRLDAAPGTATGPYQGMLIGVVPAPAGRRYAARAMDAVPPAALLAAAVIGAGDARWPVLVVLLLVGAAFAVLTANAASSLRSGQTLGRRLLRLRTVDDLSGAPLTAMDRFGRIPRLLRQRTTVTADLRAGRDPLGVARPPADALGDDVADDDAGPTVDEAVRRAHRRTTSIRVEAPAPTGAALVLDSGERLAVTEPLVVGRKPEAQVDGVTHVVHTWTDLSRTVAKSHALFAWSGSSMWITDLGSLSGTAVITPEGERRPLVAGVPTAASVGWTVELGRRRIVIEPGAPEATASESPTAVPDATDASPADAVSDPGLRSRTGSRPPTAAPSPAVAPAPTPTERTAPRAD